MALLEQDATTEQARRRRPVVLVVVAVVACLVAGLVAGAAWRATRPVPLSTPLFGTTDGLPSTLVAGKDYTATLTIAVGADWNQPGAPWVGDGNSFGVGAAVTYPGVENSILCTSGEFAPGTAITLTCPFTAPDAVGPFTVSVGWPWLETDAGKSGVPEVTGPTMRTYQHTLTR